MKPIKSIDKMCQILDCFSEEQPKWSVADLAAELSIPKSTLSTLLSTLRSCGYLDKDDTRDSYRLGLRFFELGYVVRSELPVRALVLPVLEELQDKTNENVYLTIPRKGKVLYLEAVYSHRTLMQYSVAGRLTFMHSTAAGKAILAYMDEAEVDSVIAEQDLPAMTPQTIVDPTELKVELEQTRERGYAIDNCENDLAIRCTAVAIRDSTGRARGSISISGPAVHFDPETIATYASYLHSAISTVSRYAHLLPHEASAQTIVRSRRSRR